MNATSILTINTEQINSLPLLLGIFNDMGIRDLIDAHVTPHGNWEGASVGTLVSIWLSHLLQKRDHRLVAVREWAAERVHTINTLLGITLRDTDCTDDRLANVLTRLGAPDLQQTLDMALTQRWLRVYRLPTATLRLDSTSVSVYHDPDCPSSLLQLGQSKDQRPDLRQFKAMLATLDPLGLPLVCPILAGNAADDGAYIPTYQAAVAALDTTAVLVVGDCKMGALATRGHLVAHGSAYLCAYHPPSATALLAAWVDQALARPERWHWLASVDPHTGEVTRDTAVDVWQRQQTWSDPTTLRTQTWTERVLVLRSTVYQAGLRRRLEARLARLTTALSRLTAPPTRGRTRYRQPADLQAVVAARLAEADLTGVVQVTLSQVTLPTGTTGWVVAAIWVDRAAWQARVARLGWQVYLTSTTPEQYDLAALVSTYRHQPIHERGFSRLKSRNLHIRPVYLRDETRLAGLLWLLCLALRVLTLTEYRLRTALDQRREALAGLNPASRTQTTSQPTTERILNVFSNLTLTHVAGAGWDYWHVSDLNATQQHVIDLLGLPHDLYSRLGTSPPNLLSQLRE